jgi:glycosyltransferase involved in cell wall biosynthesis
MGCNSCKKILHISNFYPPHNGGIENTCRDVISITNSMYDNFVLCSNDKPKTSSEIIDGVFILRLFAICKIFSQSVVPFYRKRLQNIINEYNPDYIHIHLPNPIAMIALLLCKYQNKIIIHWHSDIVKQKLLKYIFKPLEINLCKKSDRIIATSLNYINYSDVLKRFKNKTIVVPNIISDTKISISDKIKTSANKLRLYYQDKIICLAIGRHVSYKGFGYLINSAKLLDKSRYFFVFIGDGPLTKSLKERAIGFDNILFTGTVSDDEMKAWQLICDIFCFSSISKNEAFGISLAETMYFGKPAITFTIEGSGVNYVSLNNVTGLEAENKNIEMYAKLIERLGNNITLREMYGKNARERVINNFTKEQMFSALKNIYVLV